MTQQACQILTSSFDEMILVSMDRVLKNSTLIRNLKLLTLAAEDNSDSGMQHAFDAFALKQGKVNAQALVYYKHKLPIAWALLNKERTFYIVDYSPEMGTYLQLYVNKNYRGKGLATKLINRVREILPPEETICVLPWSPASKSFYKKHSSKNLLNLYTGEAIL